MKGLSCRVSECKESSNKFQRLDHYWNAIFDVKNSDGNPKFKFFPILVKALLCLAHDNADCERGFSINNQFLGDRSSLSIESVNDIRDIKSYVNEHKEIIIQNLFVNINAVLTRKLLENY